MERISFGSLLAPLEQRGFADERSDTRRRVSLATLFSTLPSQSREPGERALQLETYAQELSDLAPEVVEHVVHAALKSEKVKWVPSIGQLRFAAARIIRRLRYAATGATPASDYHPEHGVTFNAEREIDWALRNAEALTAGVIPQPIGPGMERHQPVFKGVMPALARGPSVPLLSGGPESDAEYLAEYEAELAIEAEKLGEDPP